MIGFSDSLRMELARSGVSVTVVCPSWVVTEFHERLMDKEGTPKGPEGRRIYTKRTMTADRCAEIIMEAAGRRKREAIIWPGPLAMWFRLIAPSVLDRIIVRTFLRLSTKGK
ncbi:MAG: hypothetical protein JXL84_26820 [Deltaproteobacteria bacterium]|nr:hypothetical protein [Deltaproteobacteria bacterium]